MRMTIPDHISPRWIAALDNDQLVTAEAELYAVFRAQEQREKVRKGAHYILLQGPATLVTAWQRWMLVSNETGSRGLMAHRRA
jgi:hypothetical protein